MQLQKRTVGPGNTFFPFKRLPIEMRYLVWQFTLEPRVVDLDHDFHAGYVTHTLVPTALRVCWDSRNAVLSLYPFSFGSEKQFSKIRFNFSLDTLYLHDFAASGDGDRELFDFLERLDPDDAANLQNIAISGSLGEEEDDEVTEKYWGELETWLERLQGLKPIFTVRDVADVLESFLDDDFIDTFGYGRWRTLESVRSSFCSYCPSRDHFIELLGNFPDEIIELTNLSEEELHAFHALEEDFQPHVQTLHDNEQIGKKARHVYGWWRPK